MQRICTKCGEAKPPTDYYKDPRGKDGLFRRCKPCHRAGSRAWEKRNHEHYRTTQRLLYWKDPEGRRATTRASQLKRAAEGRLSDRPYGPKEKARCAVAAALAAGKLKRGGCEVCGQNSGRIEAHHDDYSLPLTVRWLCPKHHRRHHAGLTADGTARRAE